MFVYLQNITTKRKNETNIIITPNMELIIKEGYCYQVINNLQNVASPSTACMLMKLASSKGAVEVSQDDALERGFEELANWSMPEYDRLYIIDDFILVCLPKNGGPYA